MNYPVVRQHKKQVKIYILAIFFSWMAPFGPEQWFAGHSQRVFWGQNGCFWGLQECRRGPQRAQADTLCESVLDASLGCCKAQRGPKGGTRNEIFLLLLAHYLGSKNIIFCFKICFFYSGWLKGLKGPEAGVIVITKIYILGTQIMGV